MPRKRIARHIHSYPLSEGLKPRVVNKQLEEPQKIIQLNLDEAEAMRLKDMVGLSQEEAAESMKISRQTYQNVLESGRKKVTEALWKGYGVEMVNNGNLLACCDMKCEQCGSVYSINEQLDKERCPKCGHDKVVCVGVEACKKWC